MSKGRHTDDHKGDKRNWRLIFNPRGDAADVAAYAASVAEGRIAGRYQLSTTAVPDTLIIQQPGGFGLVIGADIEPNRDAAGEHGIEVARMARSGRGGAKQIGTVNLGELTAKAPRRFEARDTDPEDAAVILYTSGTTGSPKGAVITHRSFHFQCGTVVDSIVPFQPEDRCVVVLPLYHIYGLANALMPSISHGACGVLIGTYSPRRLIDVIAESRATILPAIPSMYFHLLSLARARKTSIPESLKYCISGGAALPMSVLQDFAEVYDTKIMEGYGLTETTSSVCANGSTGILKDGSIGPAAEGVEMRVYDENGREADNGTEGEIVIRSRTLFKEYWKQPEATAAVFTSDGFFRTGDLGYRDQDGFFFITDRKKDIIITRGFNISPREVEEVLMQHPKVEEAALVVVKDERHGETITAFVIPRGESDTLSEDELRRHAELNLAEYKRPKAYRFAESLPKSATGKILRAELRGEAEDRRLIQKEGGDERSRALNQSAGINRGAG